MDLADDNKLLNMSANEATNLLKEAGIDFRVVAEDGEHFIVTMDYLPQRRNLEINNGKITGVYRG